MPDKTPDLLIRSPTRRNKLFALLCGSLLCVMSTVVIFWWPGLELLILLGYLSGVLLIFVGILKYSEPVHSLSLTKETLSYIHRYGSWSISWHDVILVSHPSVSLGLERCYIPYIGIKLRDIAGAAQSVSPRLASRQIHEQRDILMLAHQQELLSIEQITINFSDFTLDNNESINGPRAAWLHQMQALRSAYGCDLYVPITSFTHSPQQMIALLNKYRLAAACHSSNLL